MLLTENVQVARSVSRRAINTATLIVLVGMCCWIFSLPLRSHQSLLGFAQDDFYYYLKPAQSLAQGRLPTFDGSTPTNGFHPLYLLLLAAVSIVTRSLRGVFGLLWALDVLSATAAFLLTRLIFYRVTANPLLSNACALSITLLCIPLICNQMEVTLALPLGLAFLAVGFVSARRYTPERCAWLGLLGAVTMLARLDASILVLLFLVGLALVRENRIVFSRQNMLSFTAAALPLPILYLAINHHFFHVLMPISGIAKQLRHGWRPSQNLITSFAGLSILQLEVAITAALVGWATRRYLRPEEKVFLFAGLSTPFIFYSIELFVSDWPLWNWYFYALRYASTAALLMICIVLSRNLLPRRYRALRHFVRRSWPIPVFYAANLVVLFNTHYKVDSWMVEIQHAASVLNKFEGTHPGKYAMGDRAGMFGYLTPASVLQTEGLVMDRVYVDHIRAQEDLRSVLASYGVNYYVAFVFSTKYKRQFFGPCFHAMEPSIAGPDSPRMRSDFCDPPLFQFPGFDGKYLIYRINPSFADSPSKGDRP